MDFSNSLFTILGLAGLVFIIGGWGYRINFRQGRALNVKGNKGIKIELLSGKKLLLGTQNPIEAQEAIANFKK